MATSLNSLVTDLRKPHNKRRVYFGTWTPDIVFEATLTTGVGDKFTYLPVSTGTGDITDCLPGFTVRVFSAAGKYKGTTNVRAYGTPSPGVLPIRENGNADIKTISGDIVRVYNFPYLGDKLPVDDATFAPDGLPYGTQGVDYRPNCVSGGHYIGLTDRGETFATVPMWGAESDNLDPTSTPGNGTHLWELLTNTLAFQSGSADSDADPVIEASVGYGIARHTYTDNDNGTSWSQYVCFQVDARDGSVPGFELLSATLNGEELAGWSADVEVRGIVSRTDLPDGQMCGLFVDETIAGLHQSVGGQRVGREHIKFIGFLTGDENAVSYRHHRTRFTLQSPLARYASLPGWSKVLTRTASPVDWTGMAGLTAKLAIYHLPKYYSFITELFDFLVDDNFIDHGFNQFFLNKMTADAQVRELADGQDARLVNLRTGELLLHTHPAYIPITDRSGVPKLLTIAPADVKAEGSFRRDHWKTLETLELRAFRGGSNNEQVYFSRYPGNTPGRGNQSVTVEKVIAIDQVDANDRAGRRAAKINGAYGEYQTLTGDYEPGVEWTPQLFGSYDALDFHCMYLNTTLDASSNGRGVDLSSHLFWLSRVSVTYHANGTADVNPTLVTATNGAWGATYIPPKNELPPYTPPEYIPPPWFPPGNPGGRIPGWTGELPISGWVVASGEAKTAQAVGFDPVTGTIFYEDRSTGLSGLGLWGRSNPYNYDEKFLLTDDGLEYCASLTGNAGWSMRATNADMFGDSARVGHELHMSINRRGWILAACGRNVVAVSPDYGVSWTVTTVDGAAADYSTTVEASGKCSIAVSSNGAGPRVVAIAPDGSTDSPQYVSEDGGWTWGASIGEVLAGTNQRYNLEIPYKKAGGAANANDGSMVAYSFGVWAGFSPYHTQKNTLSPFVLTSLWTGTDGIGRVPQQSLIGSALSSFTHDANYWWFIARNQSSASDLWVGYTDDEFATRNFVLNLSGLGAGRGMINGWSMNPNAAIVFSRHSSGTLRMTLDGGATWFGTKPSGWSGGVAYAEFSLADFIQPS